MTASNRSKALRALIAFWMASNPALGWHGAWRILCD